MTLTKICTYCSTEYQKPPHMGYAQFSRSRYCGKPCKGNAMRGDVVARFWSKVDKGSDSECWNWKAKSKHRFGYGAFADKRGKQKNIGAHRFSYELSFGPIPSGLDVLHRCDNPACVNPSHLFLGSQTDNMRDMDAKGRRVLPESKGEKNGNSKLSDAEVQQIRSLYPSLTQQQIADQFGINQAYVSTLIRGKMRHVAYANNPCGRGELNGHDAGSSNQL